MTDESLPPPPEYPVDEEITERMKWVAHHFRPATKHERGDGCWGVRELKEILIILQEKAYLSIMKCDICELEIDYGGADDYYLFHHSNLVHVIAYKNSPVEIRMGRSPETDGAMTTITEEVHNP